MENKIQPKKMILLDTDPVHNFLVSLVMNRLNLDYHLTIIKNAAELRALEAEAEEDNQILAVYSHPSIFNIRDMNQIAGYLKRTKTTGIIFYVEMDQSTYQVWKDMGFTYIIPKPFTTKVAQEMMDVFENAAIKYE